MTTNEQLLDAPRPNHSTGPKTPEGKARCRLNAFRHGLTGQVHVFTPEDQQAYEQHCKEILASLAAVGALELNLAQSIASGHWRLKRAEAIETNLFAEGMKEHPADNTGHEQVDNAFSQSRTWRQDAHNLQLLTLYEQRIQRAMDKNMAQLKALQAERKAEAKEAMRQAMLLFHLAQAEGKPYQPEAYFITAPEVRESVFSTPEIARELNRAKLFQDAKNCDYNRTLPQTDEPKHPVEAYSPRAAPMDQDGNEHGSAVAAREVIRILIGPDIDSTRSRAGDEANR